jgi:hypothetical protein
MNRRKFLQMLGIASAASAAVLSGTVNAATINGMYRVRLTKDGAYRIGHGQAGDVIVGKISRKTRNGGYMLGEFWTVEGRRLGGILSGGHNDTNPENSAGWQFE